MLSITELANLENSLKEILSEKLLEIITRMNQTDKLNTWLEMMGLESLLEINSYRPYKTAKIIVIGASEQKENILTGIAKSLGISAKRLEFCLDYNAIKSFQFTKLQYNANYSLVLVGSMPHKTLGTGNFSSTIARMEQEDGFPPLLRVGNNTLKITKTSFRKALEKALEDGQITAS